jgi:dTDP-4-amino-4,6-dideoxygalactose transaminase
MRHSWHLYQIAVGSGAGGSGAGGSGAGGSGAGGSGARPGPGIDRNALGLALREEGIGTSVHFKPLHLFPWYQQRLGLREGLFPAAEKAFAETLSLPIWPDMRDLDVDRVIARVRYHVTGKE